MEAAAEARRLAAEAAAAANPTGAPAGAATSATGASAGAAAATSSTSATGASACAAAATSSSPDTASLIKTFTLMIDEIRANPQTYRPPVEFATTPGQVKVEELLDLTSKSGSSNFRHACESIPIKFSGHSTGTVVFVNQMIQRARESGWSTGTQQITQFNVAAPGAPPKMMDIFTSYGQIPVTALMDAYHNWINNMKDKRVMQNNEMMQQCIINSLTADALTRLIPEYPQFEEVPSSGLFNAPMLFKTIMKLATVDSKATSTFLREIIHNLDAYMAVCNSDIDQLHLHFTTCMNQLVGRGGTIDEPMGCLFKAYRHCRDGEFKEHMHLKENDWLEDAPNMAGMDYHGLINLATQKFNIIRAMGEWGEKSAEEQRIVALSAEIDGLRGQLKLSHSVKAASNDRVRKSPNPAFKCKDFGRKGPGKPSRENQFKKKVNKDKKYQKETEAWKKKPPAAGDPHTMTKDAKTYHWCVHHMAWCIHTAENCLLRKSKEANHNLPVALPVAQTYVANTATTSPRLHCLLSSLERECNVSPEAQRHN